MTSIQDLIDHSGGNLDKAIRAFDRQYRDHSDKDKQAAADTFNALWVASGNRPLKRAKGVLLRLIWSGRCRPPAGYCQIENPVEVYCRERDARRAHGEEMAS
jgi:hypothetical protein